ncbi:hypothetical protein [Rhizobium gallicum]|uniref:hypothetical protein n=1 Tax=Rhizobium gallicum TaxID=56730 RepID=UPI001EF89693|nr:hypothetical protein [Rhizobium gallicum]ULJ75537.1 hypothetical protein L2W42_35800 [Rhizobium gallicum]
MEPETLFSNLHLPRVAFFLYFRKQMKATPPKGKQMKGSLIEEKRGAAGTVRAIDIAKMPSTS